MKNNVGYHWFPSASVYLYVYVYTCTHMERERERERERDYQCVWNFLGLLLIRE